MPIESAEVDGFAPRVIGYAESAAEIEDADLRIVNGIRREHTRWPKPALEIEIPAAAVGVEPDDARASRCDGLRQFRELLGWYAELRMKAAGTDFLVMAVSLPRIETEEYFPSAKKRGPGLQDVKVVDREPQSLRERPAVSDASQSSA